MYSDARCRTVASSYRYRGVPWRRASSTRSQPPTSMWPAALTRYVTGKSKVRLLVRARAARAARAAAAAAAGRLGREVRDGRRIAAGEGEARDHHPRLGRFARRTHLRGVALGEPCQELELLGAAVAAILVDRHLSERC